MTTPLPENAHPPASTPPSPEARHRARVKLARKCAYLVNANSYLPHAHTEIEQIMLEFVDSIFDAVAGDPVDIEAVTAVGTSLVALNCVSRESLRCTMEVLTSALLQDQEVRRLDRMPVRVAQVLGALTSGVADAARQSAVDQQEGMCRTLMKIARRAMRETEAHEAKLDETSTELSLLQGQLGHQLLHDPRTGLPNRQFCTTRLEEVLVSGRPVTLYRLELDGFALVNDGLGQPLGDRWLAAAAERIHTVVTDRATLIARLDGANFAILQESTPSTTDIAMLVRKLNAVLAEPAYFDGVGLASTVSVGVVQSPPHQADPGALLHAADLALRAAKHHGPGQWVQHAPDTDTGERRLLRLALGMPGAWETGQLAVGYQLRVRLVDEAPVGVHAFVRWRDECGDDARRPCLALAEQTGMTPRLSEWLLHDAATQLRAWSRQSGTDLTLAVSLSPHQSAAPDLLDTVLHMLDDTELRPERLQIVMPAAEVFHGREQAVENLTLVAEAGTRTAVHDFGGGAAELLQLADLPIHEVWLGEDLVHHARRAGEESVTAVTGLIRLVHRTGAAVGIGNIQDRAEADWWRRAGANIATGPLFSPPDAPTDIAALFG